MNETFNISAQTYYDWKKKFEQGYFEKKTKQTRRRKIDKEKLKLAIEEKPDAYLREIAEKFNCSEQAVFYALKRMNITYKKTFTYSEKSEIKRVEYVEKPNLIDKEKRVYVDESGINKFYQREHARSLRGIKLEDTKRGRKFERINVIGGLCNGKYIGIKCYKNKTNSIFFEDWFQNTLIPNLTENSTVIMDKASFHRNKDLMRLMKNLRLKCYFYHHIRQI